MSSKICPRCQKRKFYRVRRDKFRCRNCLYEFKPKLGNLRLSRAEVDETYLGGQKKNKRKSVLLKEKLTGRESKRGFGTKKQLVFGILARSGKVFARLVGDVEARDLVPIIEKKVKRGSRICSDTWRAYTGLATRGYLHRTVEHQKKEYALGKNHINGLEGFFGYLKRKLATKGGVRRKYLSLFLSEYVWRYNYRQLTVNQRVNRLLKLLEDFSG